MTENSSTTATRLAVGAAVVAFISWHVWSGADGRVPAEVERIVSVLLGALCIVVAFFAARRE